MPYLEPLVTELKACFARIESHKTFLNLSHADLLALTLAPYSLAVGGRGLSPTSD